MTPAELKAALERGTKTPWFWKAQGGYPQQVLANDDGLVLIAETYDGGLDEPPVHPELITLAVNLAPLFLELWEAAEGWRRAEDEWAVVPGVAALDGIVTALDRLAAEDPTKGTP